MQSLGRPVRPKTIAVLVLVVAAAASVEGARSSSLDTKIDGDEGSSRPFVIGFGTSLDEEPPAAPHRTLLMRAGNGTLYRCFLPPLEGAAGEEADSGSGDGSIASAAHGSLGTQKKPTELLEALGEHCYYYYDEWWTYELCYRKHVRQYHKSGEGQLEGEYLLGVYDELEQPEDEDAVQVDTADLSGGMRYVSQLYAGGEVCELTQEPRQAEVRFTCGTDGGGTRLAAIKEPSSCRYVLIVATPRLCKHPAFQDQPVSAALIRCHPLPEDQAAGGAATTAAGQCSTAADGSFAAPTAADGGASADNATHDAADAEVMGESDDGLITSLVEGGADYTDEDDNDPYA
ncbi:hypothetical protein ABPG77_010695 [Micractinium sp. CCAP 211/92]